MKRVGAAPARHPVLDVAGLAAEVARAVAVEEAVADDRVGAGGVDERLLLEPDLGVGGVGEEEEVEGRALAVGLDVVEHGDRRAEDARGVLVVGRHQERGASGERRAERGRRRRAEEEAHQRRDRAEDDPDDVDDEEDEHDLLDPGQPADREHEPHLVDEERGQRQRCRRRARCGRAGPESRPRSRKRRARS